MASQAYSYHSANCTCTEQGYSSHTHTSTNVLWQVFLVSSTQDAKYQQELKSARSYFVKTPAVSQTLLRIVETGKPVPPGPPCVHKYVGAAILRAKALIALQWVCRCAINAFSVFYTHASTYRTYTDISTCISQVLPSSAHSVVREAGASSARADPEHEGFRLGKRGRKILSGLCTFFHVQCTHHSYSSGCGSVFRTEHTRTRVGSESSTNAVCENSTLCSFSARQYFVASACT
jgi:hypothetical protein